MEHKYTAIPPPTNTYTTTPDVGAHGVGNSADAPSSGNVSPSTKVSTYSIAPSKPPPGQRTLSDDGSPSTATPTRRHALVFANWWLEIGACCLFIIALVAIFATLYPHQGKPQPQWPYGISVNSLIAIYVVVFKSAVLLVTAEGLGQLKWGYFRATRPLEDFIRYDEASRGPLGSLKLLARLRLQHPLSSCGAIITLLLLAADPISQQIIRYRTCDIVVAGQQAKIPRTNVYRIPRNTSTRQGSFLQGHEPMALPPELQSAINAGVFSPDQRVLPSCPSGNCTFARDYTTLGYCHHCQDVSNELSFRTDPQDDQYIYSYLPSGTNMTFSGMRASVNLTTMSNPELGTVEIIQGKMDEILDPATGTAPEGCEPTSQNAESIWRCRGYGAARCTLEPCLRTYTAKVFNGAIEESLTASFVDQDQWAYEPAIESFTDQTNYNVSSWFTVLDSSCLNLQERDALEAEGYALPSDASLAEKAPNQSDVSVAKQRFVPYNITFTPFDGFPIDNHTHTIDSTTYPGSLLAHSCLYALQGDVPRSVAEYLRTFFTGTLQGELGRDNSDRAVTKITGPQNLQSMYDYGRMSPGGIERVFANVASAMTLYMRQAESNHSVPAVGEVHRSDTCLEVRWPWLAYLGAMVVFTLMFFAFMILDTRPTGGRAQIWKNSPLALLFQRLVPDAEVQNRDATVDDLKGVERLAKVLYVKLGQAEPGTTRFVQVESNIGKET